MSSCCKKNSIVFSPNFNILFVCIIISVYLLWFLSGNIEQRSIINQANQTEKTSNDMDIYEYIVTTYKWTLNNLVNSNNSKQHTHTQNISNMVDIECRPQPKELKCKFNNTCTKSFAEKLYEYPHFSQQLIKNNNFKLHSQTIQNLKYLIVSHHGGTHIATLSYLTNILNIPSKNIAHICSGTYCSYMNKFGHYYNYFNKTFSAQYNVLLRKKVLKRCCWRKSLGYWNHMERIDALQSQMYDITKNISEEYKIDVLICTFPSTQCAWLLPFAKVIIIRFMHRFNHQVWLQGIVKWGRLIHSMSNYCPNIILTASNAYDWYYNSHFLNIQTDSFLLWPNFARHFVDDYMPNINHNINTSINYNNISNFIFQMFQPAISKCAQLLNLSNLKYTLKHKYNINIFSNEKIVKKYTYDKILLHNNIGGIIAIPHSVHGAKWIEYYSVGMQLFLPSLEFWIEMNNKCNVIGHRQAGNKPHIVKRKNQPTKAFNNYIEYSPCCGISPLYEEYQNVWLQFSDYYMNKFFFKFVIHFDSYNDLIDKIIQYNNLSLMEKLKRKQIQINEFTLLSKRFAPHLINALYNSYQKSEMQCNLKLNQLTKCLIRNPYNNNTNNEYNIVVDYGIGGHGMGAFN
eukprot:56804_1